MFRFLTRELAADKEALRATGTSGKFLWTFRGPSRVVHIDEEDLRAWAEQGLIRVVLSKRGQRLHDRLDWEDNRFLQRVKRAAQERLRLRSRT